MASGVAVRVFPTNQPSLFPEPEREPEREPGPNPDSPSGASRRADL